MHIAMQYIHKLKDMYVYTIDKIYTQENTSTAFHGGNDDAVPVRDEWVVAAIVV